MDRAAGLQSDSDWNSIPPSRLAQWTDSLLPFDQATAIVASKREDPMGDRSPKSKNRDNKQKEVARSENAAAAKSKQDKQSRAPLIPAKKR